jgi:hypothetical protein
MKYVVEVYDSHGAYIASETLSFDTERAALLRKLKLLKRGKNYQVVIVEVVD